MHRPSFVCGVLAYALCDLFDIYMIRMCRLPRIRHNPESRRLWAKVSGAQENLTVGSIMSVQYGHITYDSSYKPNQHRQFRPSVEPQI
jgi:hypothetical protein